MRPVNLIPEEERRGLAGGSRTGPLSFILVGALGMVLVGVVLLVLAGNDIADREDEIVILEDQRTAAVARADRLAPYASFQQFAETRVQTVASLADSRFDWERVIRQLSLILPSDVYLNTLTGSTSGSAEGAEGATGAAPSFMLEGCASGQNAVAAFVASLKEIDGVTRVSLSSSTLSEESESGPSAEAGAVCGSGRNADFQITVAFDAAPVPPNAATAVEAPATAEPEAEGGEAESPEAEPAETSTGEPAAATVPGG